MLLALLVKDEEPVSQMLIEQSPLQPAQATALYQYLSPCQALT